MSEARRASNMQRTISITRAIRRRTSVRVRLTALYAVLLFVTGALLLAVNYRLFESATGRGQAQVIAFDMGASDTVPGMSAGPSSSTRGVPTDSGTAATGREIGETLPSYNRSVDSIVDDLLKLLPQPVAETTKSAVRNYIETSFAGPPPGITDELSSILSERIKSYQQHSLRELLRRSALALSALATVSVILGWIVAGRVLRPIHRITETARRLGETNLDERLNLDGPHDELRELGNTFDSMLDRIQVAFENERRLIANTSHELRTPLANQRTLVDVTLADPDATTADLRAMAEKVRVQIVRHQELIDRLILLARTDNSLVDAVDFDLSTTVASVRDGMDLSGVATLNQSLRPALMNGDSVLIERMVANLLENALIHNAQPGYLDLATETTGGTVRLTVANSGPVLTDEQLHAIRLPFRRLARDRTRQHGGLGLGLPIVESIARAHGGTVELTAIPSGGLSVTVTLPQSRVAPPTLGARV